MTTASQNYRNALAAIGTITSSAELDELFRAVKDQRRKLDGRASLSLLIGDKVSFDAKTRGIIKGTVVKVNHKTVSVLADGGMRWKVSASLLKRL
jgi:hypothetical protein